ncbi:MAG: sulfatase-like hydrolase/transferase [Thermoanaerobaculia bacterium]
MSPVRPGPRRGALLSLLLAVVGACGHGQEPAAPAGPPPVAPQGTPVVLISIDTLRSDHLPVYGHDSIETPAIDGLRADGIRFDRAYTHVTLTLPSHTTILTGELPVANGVRDNLGYRFDAGSNPYLPRILREAGYATGGFVSAYVLRATTGLAEGFDVYDDRVDLSPGVVLGDLQRPGPQTLDAARVWLEKVRTEPFFLFFHLYEPHTPYTPPEPWASRYGSAYDGEVAAADSVVGDLLDTLRKDGLYDRSLIVLLSDHGEGLGDHGEQEHELLLHREVLQVPLIVKLPGNARAGSSIPGPVQLTDVLPGILQVLGLEAPEGLAGRSLFADPDPERLIYSENVYGRLHFGWSELTSAISGADHLIFGPKPELYDLVADPGETENLVNERRRTAQTLRDALQDFDHELQPPGSVDSATRSKLESLGYVSTFTAQGNGPPADPKSKLPVMAALNEARSLRERGKPAEAAARYREVLADEPGLMDGWMGLGKCLQEAGRPREAIQPLQKAMALSGGAGQVAVALAEVYASIGDLDAAKEHAELAAETDDAAVDMLAQIAIYQGDLEEAEKWVMQAVERRGARGGPLVTLAELRLRQHRPQEALELTEQAERERGDLAYDFVRGLYFTRGKALTELERPAEAVASFEKEIELAPDYLPAYTHLAFLHALMGDAPAAGRALQRLVENNPTPKAYASAVRTLQQMNDPRSAAEVLREARRRWPDAPELRELDAD